MKTSDQILNLIQNTFQPQPSIGLHEPKFEAHDLDYVRDCIETAWVSSVGKYVDGFEKKLTEITGIPYAVAIVNGTCALEICLKLAGVEAGQEVLIPSLTFVATANAVSHCGAIPHFVASEEKTFGIDAQALETYLKKVAKVSRKKCLNQKTGRAIKALVPVHIYGTPSNLEALLEICRRYHLELVEDAAESLGSYYQGKHTGSFGKVASLSFNGNKIVTTGGGGAILTTNEKLAVHAKHLTTTAKKPHPFKFFHDEIGYNYRLPNLNAALGLSQLERFDALIEKKRAIHGAYRARISSSAPFYLHEPPANSKSNYWLNIAVVKKAISPTEAEAVFEKTLAAKIHTRPAWDLLHTLPMYKKCPKMKMDFTEELARRLICLPSSPQLASVLAAPNLTETKPLSLSA